MPLPNGAGWPLIALISPEPVYEYGNIGIKSVLLLLRLKMLYSKNMSDDVFGD